MAVRNTITYDPIGQDYLINGKPLMAHLAKHEHAAGYTPAILAQPGTIDRLAGLAKPDLISQHVAIYLCGMCGGYDGSPVGVRVEFHQTTVQWSEMGYYADFEGGISIPFQRVTGYAFDRVAYEAFLAQLRPYEIKR